MNTQNLLPFDWEIAQKQPERVVNEKGEKVTQLNRLELDHKILYFYVVNNSFKFSFAPSDLFLLPEVKECWVNVYEESFEGCLSAYYKTEQKAKDNIAKNFKYIKTIRIDNSLD